MTIARRRELGSARGYSITEEDSDVSTKLFECHGQETTHGANGKDLGGPAVRIPTCQLFLRSVPGILVFVRLRTHLSLSQVGQGIVVVVSVGFGMFIVAFDGRSGRNQAPLRLFRLRSREGRSNILWREWFVARDLWTAHSWRQASDGWRSVAEDEVTHHCASWDLRTRTRCRVVRACQQPRRHGVVRSELLGSASIIPDVWEREQGSEMPY